MSKKIEIFENYPIHKALITLAIPTILGMLVNVFYNMVDTFFVGKTGDPNQVTAVSLTMPIYLILMSFGSLYGIGGASYISRSLGNKDYDRVSKISSFVFYSSIVTGILAGFLVFTLIDPILLKIGTDNDTYQFSKDYLLIVSLGAIFVIAQMSMGQVVRSEGAAKEAMIGMVLGTIVNIILDPIMILYMKMGVAGAALATIIGNACSTLYYIWYIIYKSSFLSVKLKNFSINFKIITSVLAVGFPVALNNALINIANVYINKYASLYGNNVVAALGISMRIFMLVILVFIGLSQGVQPFIGYNYAAKNYRRMKGAIKLACLFSFSMGVIFVAFSLIFSKSLISIFIKNEEIIDYGSKFLIAAYSIAPILGFEFIIMSTFQALGKMWPSLILSVCRQGIAFVPAVKIGTALFGIYGIMWAQPIADICSVIVAFVMYLYFFKDIKENNS